MMNDKNLALNRIKNKRNRALFLLAGIAAIAGFTDAFGNNEGWLISTIRLLLPLVAIITIYYWLTLDARLLNYRIPKYIKYIIILFGIIGIPIYFWQTRKFKDFCFNLGGLWLYIFYLLIYYVFKVVVTSGLSATGYY